MRPVICATPVRNARRAEIPGIPDEGRRPGEGGQVRVAEPPRRLGLIAARPLTFHPQHDVCVQQGRIYLRLVKKTANGVSPILLHGRYAFHRGPNVDTTLLAKRS